MSAIYTVFIPAACIAGMALGALAVVFSIRNLIKKRYRLFSWIYIAAGVVVAVILARMLTGALLGVTCARGPLLTVLLYAGIDALMIFILADTIVSGRKKGA
jgi:hypothetical protein